MAPDTKNSKTNKTGIVSRMARYFLAEGLYGILVGP